MSSLDICFAFFSLYASFFLFFDCSHLTFHENESTLYISTHTGQHQ